MCVHVHTYIIATWCLCLGVCAAVWECSWFSRHVDYYSYYCTGLRTLANSKPAVEIPARECCSISVALGQCRTCTLLLPQSFAVTREPPHSISVHFTRVEHSSRPRPRPRPRAVGKGPRPHGDNDAVFNIKRFAYCSSDLSLTIHGYFPFFIFYFLAFPGHGLILSRVAIP